MRANLDSISALGSPATAAAEAAARTDWFGVGLLFSILGCFLLASALLLRTPRELLDQHLGAGQRPLISIRSFLFHRVQVSIGFLVLLLGFNLQLLGHIRPVPESARHFPLGWVGAIAALLLLLEVLAWWYARRQFQSTVRSYILEHDLELETDTKLAREVGELFGVALRPEDTVRQYAQRVRERAGLPGHLPRQGRRVDPQAAGSQARGFDDEELPESSDEGLLMEREGRVG
jgi:hypothetical protein